ncbi:MAG: replication initiator protein A [Candidatus Zapsychrus exili]|nr:replication initiator protein A [Candidatus Zapsychrus exili]
MSSTDVKKIEKKFKTRMEVNLEKIPFISFFNYKNKKKIEETMRSSKGGIQVYSQDLPDGSKRSIKLDVSMSYGLPVSEDQDVWTVVSHKISEYCFEKQVCPETIEINMNCFAKMMKKQITGPFYTNLENSLHRLAGVTLYHNQFMQKKENNSKSNLEYDAQKGIKIINSVAVLKIKKNGKRIQNVVRIELPAWIRQNYENFYTSYIDIDLYFRLKPGRTRRLFKLLDVYRYNQEYFIDYNRCDSILFLRDLKHRSKRNEKLKLALNELKRFNYVKDFIFEEYGIKVFFSTIKKAYNKSLMLKLTEADNETVDFLMTHFKEPESKAMFRNIVREYLPESIVHCLDLTDESIKYEGVKKTKGAIFMYHINKYGRKKQAVLS